VWILESPHIANKSPVTGDSTSALIDRARREGLAQWVVASGSSPKGVADGLRDRLSVIAGMRRSHSLTILDKVLGDAAHVSKRYLPVE
jgi:hypothetical protein